MIADLSAVENRVARCRIATLSTADAIYSAGIDFNAVPSKAQVMALTAGDGWLDQGANILLFGPPGRVSAILR
jgi:DNA replication protein DnaC